VKRLPRVNEYLYQQSSRGLTTRPNILLTKSVTPAQNAYGSYTTLIAGANLTEDVYELDVYVGTIAISAAARDGMFQIGVDPTGGTSFSPIVADVVAGPAAVFFQNAVGGTAYRFPILIRAGSSVGIAGSVNSATLTAFLADCFVRGKPTRPDLIPLVGQFVRSYGASIATSAGTTVVPGTSAEGLWYEIGTLVDTIGYFEVGYGINDSTMTTIQYDVDIAIGDATNKRIVAQGITFMASANETLSKGIGQGFYAQGNPGDKLYARSQSSNNTIDDNQSIAIYGVGG
jgi:hypothetical protein